MDLKPITDWDAFVQMSQRCAEQGTVLVYGEFTDQLMQLVRQSIHTIVAAGFPHITLRINSMGGDDDAYRGIVGALYEAELVTTGVVEGVAESNAAFLLEKLSNRYMRPGTSLMFHYGGTELDNQELAAILDGENWVLEKLRMFFLGEFPEIVKRSRGKISLKLLKEICRQERRLEAQQALTLGLIDKIV